MRNHDAYETKEYNSVTCDNFTNAIFPFHFFHRKKMHKTPSTTSKYKGSIVSDQISTTGTKEVFVTTLDSRFDSNLILILILI